MRGMSMPVSEKNRRLFHQEAERARVDREKHALQYNFWTLTAAIAAVVVGVIGIIVTLQH